MSKKTAFLEQNLNEILRNADTDRVLTAIEGTPGYESLSLSDQSECRELVWAAAEAFLARDLQEFQDVEFEIPLNNGRSILDMVATLKGTMAPYENYAGAKIIVDWKTTATRADSQVWRNRCVSSFQWKFYSAVVPEAKIFEYRGLTREVIFSGKEAVEFFEPERIVGQVLIELNDGLPREVEVQKGGVLAQYNALLESGLPVWPRNFDSCFDYGSVCQFKEDCDKNTMPAGTAGLDRRTDISYSGMSSFLSCPEKARRRALLRAEGCDEEEAEHTTIGIAAHRGIAVLWEQAFELRG